MNAEDIHFPVGYRYLYKLIVFSQIDKLKPARWSQQGGVQCDDTISRHLSLRGRHLPVELERPHHYLRHRRHNYQVKAICTQWIRIQLLTPTQEFLVSSFKKKAVSSVIICFLQVRCSWSHSTSVWKRLDTQRHRHALSQNTPVC